MRKEIVNELDIVRDEGNGDSFAEPSVALSAGPSVHPSVSPSFPPMSTTFDSEQAFTQLLSFTKSIDAHVVNRLDVLEAQNWKLLYHQ